MAKSTPTVSDIHSIIESWAPGQTAWEEDNVGHLVGRKDAPVRRLLLALDLTEEIVAEARRARVQLIVTHHPVIFHPVSSVTDYDRTGRLLLQLIEEGISVVSAHTNLDFARHGVSESLALILGLGSIRILYAGEGKLEKVVVFVPKSHADVVADAMAKAGAGSLGEYDDCSFRVEGTGTFTPSSHANPYIGRAGEMERVEEVRIEMILPSWKRGGVLAAMRSVHPYEEVAYDVYDLSNPNPYYGAGTIGTLPRPLTQDAFLRHVRRKLRAAHLRFVRGRTALIERVAVCGGAGSDLVGEAVRQHADALVTADVKYHTFLDAEGCLTLVDAGHFETESVAISPLARRLKEELRRQGWVVSVQLSKYMKNPVQWL